MGTEKDKRDRIKEEILEAYFQFRSPLPGDGFVAQHRSTEELQDELANMYPFSKEELAEYMMDHEYTPLTETDGSVKWAIWRFITA